MLVNFSTLTFRKIFFFSKLSQFMTVVTLHQINLHIPPLESTSIMKYSKHSQSHNLLNVFINSSHISIITKNEI